MAALGAHTLRTQTIPKGPKLIAGRSRRLGWKFEQVDIFTGARTAFHSFPGWFLAGVWADGDRQATFSVA